MCSKNDLGRCSGEPQGPLGGLGHLLGADPILEPIFRETVSKTLIVHVMRAARHSEADEADEPDEGKMVHDRQLGP